MALHAHRARLDLLDQGCLAMPMPLAEDADVDRPVFECTQHHGDVAGARRDGGRIGTVRGTCSAPDQRRGAVRQRRLRLLRRNEVDVRVDAGGGKNQVRAGDGVGSQADFEARGDPIHRLWIAGLADAANATVLDADIGFDDPQYRIDDRHVGDHEVGRAARARYLIIHAHAFAHALAAAEDNFVAVTAAEVAFNFDEQAGIAQADAITGRRAEKADIFLSCDRWHEDLFERESS